MGVDGQPATTFSDHWHANAGLDPDHGSPDLAEIMRTLKSLCKPDPNTMEIPWEIVRAATFKVYGSNFLEDPYYNAFHAFQLIVTSVGHKSEIWKEIFNWAASFVDESRRQIQLNSCITLASYPHQFRNIIKMHLKFIGDRMPRSLGLALALPCSISHRLQYEGSKHAWPDLM